MHNAALVTVEQPLEDLPDDAPDLVERQRHSLLVQVVLHVPVEKLEDQVQLVPRVEHVQQIHDERVVELLQQGDLADGSRRDTFVGVFDLDFLEGHDLTG